MSSLQSFQVFEDQIPKITGDVFEDPYPESDNEYMKSAMIRKRLRFNRDAATKIDSTSPMNRSRMTSGDSIKSILKAAKFQK
ncbi:hypothetical protein pb186bvf_006023 [Paramecium bursaria]